MRIRMSLVAIAVFAFLIVAAQDRPTSDPLPSWNEGPAKQAILNFVNRVGNTGSPDFVPLGDRIAVFDNDGTLWPENPIPFELAYTFDRVRAEAEKRPELKDRQPFKAVIENDIPGLVAQGKKAIVEVLVATHTGTTPEDFEASVREWIVKAEHPRYKKRYTDLTYLPMQEVLAHLRANGFKTFIVSGGSAEFMRVWSNRVYGIPSEQVVGTTFKTKYELRDGKPIISILPDLNHIDDKAGKPIGIHTRIGRRPIAAFGNSDGDWEMLQYTTIGRAPSFGLLVHHTDAEREYAYDAHPKSSGKLVEALADAPKRGWVVVDMKKDWKRIFSFEP
jgi:phosphoglycolate phosphatase-like HAD superfamily hydrolase